MVQGTGKCCIALLPAIVATVAIAASLLSTIWCEAIVFKPSSGTNPALDDLVTSDGFADLKFGLYYYSKIQEITEETEEKDLFSVTQSCTYYGSDVSMDAAWKTARAFALIAPILGGILALGLFVSPCCIFFTRPSWNKIAFMFLLVVPAFQSLTLLILTSNACQENPVIESRLSQWIKVLGMNIGTDGSSASAATAAESNFTNSTVDGVDNSTSTSVADESESAAANTETEAALMGIYSDECEWDWGTYANLASMILFFLTGVVMLVMGPPTRPDPKEPEVQTITYQQTTNENGEAVVQEVDIQTNTDPVAETTQEGGPGWADPSHTAKPY